MLGCLLSLIEKIFYWACIQLPVIWHGRSQSALKMCSLRDATQAWGWHGAARLVLMISWSWSSSCGDISSCGSLMSFMWDEQRRHRLLNIVGTSWPKRKYVTDAHCALIQMCRHSLKVHSGWWRSSCKTRTVTLCRTVSCLYCKCWLHRTRQFCRQFDNNFHTLLGDVRHFVSGWPNRLLPGMRPRHPWWHWHLWGCVEFSEVAGHCLPRFRKWNVSLHSVSFDCIP